MMSSPPKTPICNMCAKRRAENLVEGTYARGRARVKFLEMRGRN